MAKKWTNAPLKWLNEGTEPSESLKQGGFVGGYKPAASTFNYFLSNFYKCLTELQTTAGKSCDDIETLKTKKTVGQDTGSGEIFNDYDMNIATGAHSHAEGSGTEASGECSHAEGTVTQAISFNSHAEGWATKAEGENAHSEGFSTTAQGYSSHAEGQSTSRAEEVGDLSTVDDDTILAVWGNTKFSLAKGSSSHCEGKDCLALGDFAHAEGWETKAKGRLAHTEGYGTEAGEFAHAQGYKCTANGKCAHSGGQQSTAGYDYSFAQGYCVNASAMYQSVIGKHNKTNTNGLFIVGYGSSSATANCLRIADDGKCYGVNAFLSSGADYAEMFEWLDGNPDNEDRRGLFVTLDGEKIRLANSEDDYIIGIVSASPTVVGDICSEEWHGMFKKDVFGADIWEDVEVPEEVLEDGTVIPAHIEKQRVLTPEYDPTQEYVSRDERKEWATVGMFGKLVAVDDGTCKINEYCTVGENGIATISKEKTSYRVMGRIDENHIKILVK